MRIIADLHIHSPYSRATSASLTPPVLEYWARIKGLGLVGTGDCTHPVWLRELRNQLEDAETGLYTLRGAARTAGFPAPEDHGAVPRFALTGEISTIYKKGEKTRKVHHLVILPDFTAAGAFQRKLERVGSIESDGRPVLGLDSRDLLAMLLDADERSLLIPAHIWTPWFSALGAKSGFDSIEECYGDMAPRILAVETGLSSNPPMNWALSSLDRFAIISNSDAHSPEKLGREATIFDLDAPLSLPALAAALDLRCRGGPARLAGTVEFFPQEGKYHYDGHRACGVCLTPEETREVKGVCPVCRKPLTQGVMTRVLALSNRPVDENAPYTPENSGGNRRPYASLIPLKELLAEILGAGAASKKVDAAYTALIAGSSELSLLMEAPLDALEQARAPKVSGELLAASIGRMREGKVAITPGYDGEYGIIRAAEPLKNDKAQGELSIFTDSALIKKDLSEKSEKSEKDLSSIITLTSITPVIKDPEGAEARQEPVPAFTPDPEQGRAISYDGKRACITAGPGTGKTATLAARIALLLQQGVDPACILALSFTVKAAAELGGRIQRNVKTLAGGTASTFHSLCAAILREQEQIRGFTILGDDQRDRLLRTIARGSKRKKEEKEEKKEPEEKSAPRGRQSLGRYIETRKRFLLMPGERSLPQALAPCACWLGIPEPENGLEILYSRYQDALQQGRLLDLDDLIVKTVRLLAEDTALLRRCQDRFRFIFVDEYQDINAAQYTLIRLLAPGRGESLWVIGDPDQSIYGFRGSDKRFMDRFVQDYPDAAAFHLSRSFRCAGPVIDAACRLTGAPLQGTSAPARVFSCGYPHENAEARDIARRIARLIGGTSFYALDRRPFEQARDRDAGLELTGLDSCAILLRTLKLAGPFVKALGVYGIPCALSGEKPWWEAGPAARILQALRDNQRRGAARPPSEAAQEVWDRLKKAGEPPGCPQRLLDMAALYTDIEAFLDAFALSGGESGFEARREGVRIITIHASKGLEFEHVFVPALEEGILPFTGAFSFDSPILSEEALAEEKRLLYVAMTRAKTGLYLSYTEERRAFHGARGAAGKTIKLKKSRFFNDLEPLVPGSAGHLDSPQKKRKPLPQPQIPLF
ncbi:MAG: UvrD-helicase domain-containing protein [Spirochaetaceae bacterium]|jgi:uncharacterized protein (TIGR00375 family)|nr:UvrD-helicase domain-containing protein [Spirochaetaceae bacterium]